MRVVCHGGKLEVTGVPHFGKQVGEMRGCPQWGPQGTGATCAATWGDPGWSWVEKTCQLTSQLKHAHDNSTLAPETAQQPVRGAEGASSAVSFAFHSPASSPAPSSHQSPSGVWQPPLCTPRLGHPQRKQGPSQSCPQAPPLACVWASEQVEASPRLCFPVNQGLGRV